jgi:uncharacterized membrane protein YdbT with pleckstrin-like domain
MSYIDNNLLPDEKILFRTRKHFIIFYVPVVLLIIAALFCLQTPLTAHINATFDQSFARVPYLQNIHNLPAFAFVILAAYSSLQPFLLYTTADYAVTNKRVIMREGFFERRISDTRLSTISHVSVDQGPLAQAMNFGNITINSFGGTGDNFTLISKPNEFQKAVHAQLDQSSQPPAGR